MHTIHRPRSIVILRHGEYWWNVLYHNNFDFNHPRVKEALKHIVDTEEEDIALTPAGCDQARKTGIALAEEFPTGFDSIIYSPWLRTKQTLDIMLEAWPPGLQDRMRIRMAQSYKLAEQYQGDGVQFLSGKSPELWQYQCERLQKLVEDKHRNHKMFRRKGIQMNGEEFNTSMLGESAWEVSIRTGRVLQRLFQPHYDKQTILVVTHMAIKMWLRANLLGLTPKQVVDDLNSGRKPISNCSVSRFNFEKGVRGENGERPSRWQEIYWNKTHYEGAFQEQ